MKASIFDRLRHAEFTAVDCPTPRRCIVVGSVGEDRRITGARLPLTARWRAGRGWRVDIGDTWGGGSSTGNFTDVSCGSASSCTAVGSRGSRPSHPVTYRWNGRTWTWQVPRPAAAKRGSLYGIYCHADTSRCIAVGAWRGGTAPLVRVNGKWTTQPHEDAHRPLHLRAVACVNIRTCYAAGTKDRVLSWNGTMWRYDTVIAPPNYYTYFDVSCSKEAHCIIAGWGGSAVPVALTKQSFSTLAP